MCLFFSLFHIFIKCHHTVSETFRFLHLTVYLSPLLILYDFPNSSSWDWRKSAPTVQKSHKKHFQCYCGFICTWQAEEEIFFLRFLHSEVFHAKPCPTYSKLLWARRWNYYIKLRHQYALILISACIWGKELYLKEQLNIFEKQAHRMRKPVTSVHLTWSYSTQRVA